MPGYRDPFILTVRGQVFTFHRAMVESFPEVRAFIEWLLVRDVSPAVAAQYAKLAAKLKRTGRLVDRKQIPHAVDRTAANQYVKWKAEHYSSILGPVARALGSVGIEARLTFLRVHSLVPPFDTKHIPVLALPSVDHDVVAMMPPPRPEDDVPMRSTYVLPAPTIVMQPVPNAWTLHVPKTACAAHQDPCQDCDAIILNDAQLSVIAEAFQRAWGHNELHKLPGEAFLFGEPPPLNDLQAAARKGDKMVALTGATVTRDELVKLGARTTSEVASFVDRLREGADGVYISKAACGTELNAVLAAVWTAWQPQA